MRRHELIDIQFEKIESFLSGRKESCGVTAKDNRLFLMLLSGYLKRAHHDAIFRIALAIGVACIDDLLAGPRQECSIAYFVCYQKMQTWSFY